MKDGKGMLMLTQSKEGSLTAAEQRRGRRQGPDWRVCGHYSRLIKLPDKHSHQGDAIH